MRFFIIAITLVCHAFCSLLPLSAQDYENYQTVKATIDYNAPLRTWDGFGVNYVQTAHTGDYAQYPQEYGGFSILSEDKKAEIIDMIFGEDGLKPGLVKMFLDPLHQQNEDGSFDHETTTRYMLEFVEKGVAKSKENGRELQIITTLYSPPAYTTLQKELRGRDIDPAHKEDIARYMISWARYLQDKNLPIRYISLHNEGEDWRRWAAEGDYANFDHGHDYNLYWRPEEVADFLAFMPEMMEEAGLESVGLTPGEASRWFQFDYSGYAKAIYDNPEALENLALLTSHNFYNGSAGHRWFSGTSNNGTDLLRSARPGLHAWVTSASWGNMDTDFAWQVFMNVRLAKVNGYIPWAVIQRPPEWVGGDPNPGTAFRVNEDGTYKVLPGYYWYKQMSRAGQPGMSVAYTECMDSELQLLGFGQNGTEQPDNFIVINSGVAATWRADAVDVIANERGFHFSNKDPKTNQKRGGKYEGTRAYSRQTEKGYLTEIIIPWENIGIKPQTGETVPFDVHVKEGAYSVAGQLGWHEEGKLQLGGENANEVEQIVRLQNVRMTLKADGEVEDAWAKVPAIAIDSVRHPNTRDYLQATWKALYDDQYLYLLVDVRDETNMQARRVAVKLEGADYQRFEAYRTSEDGEQYEYLGEFKAEEGIVTYEAPSRSVTTFFGVP